MRGKLMFITGLAAGFVLGSRAGREKYEEIRTNAKKVWEHPTVQEAAGVAQAQANKLYSEGKDKINQSKLGEKLHTTGSSSTTDTTSIIKFVENNWLGGKRLGGGSFDAIAGRMDSPNGLFNWFAPHFRPVILDPATGAVVKH